MRVLGGAEGGGELEAWAAEERPPGAFWDEASAQVRPSWATQWAHSGTQWPTGPQWHWPVGMGVDSYFVACDKLQQDEFPAGRRVVAGGWESPEKSGQTLGGAQQV